MPAKRFEFAVSVDHEGRMLAEEREPLEAGEAWTPEHLVLVALARCTVASLAYHARRASISVAASAAAHGLVTKRDEDGRYAFVELDCRVEVDADPLPEGDDLRALLEKAERDCFVGASLTARPRYTWLVNGREVAAAG